MRDRKRRKESDRQIDRHRVLVREATKQTERQTDMKERQSDAGTETHADGQE